MSTRNPSRFGLLISLLSTLLLAAPLCARDFSGVEIKTEKVAEGIYVLFGSGGNIAVSVGEDGIFMIDDQFAPLTVKIRAAISVLSEKPVRFVFNTHWHGDHTGGNENFGKAGAVLVAHHNVRKRLSAGQLQEFFNRQVPPAPTDALPVITFGRDLTFHLNGEEIKVFHVEQAHTDGDSVVRFEKADVVHVGDIYFNGIYPFIDLSSGGSVEGVIKAVEQVLSSIDEKTIVIPGHGQISNGAELQTYHSMLATVRDRVKMQIGAGKSLEETIAARPTAEFDNRLGDGFIKPDQFVEIVYRSLTEVAERTLR